MLLKETRDGNFLLKSSCFSSQVYLDIWVPSKVGFFFFAWEASWIKILTLDHLKRRGRALANRCFLCEEEEVTVEHLLVHCSKARLLWELLFAIVGVNWVFP